MKERMNTCCNFLLVLDVSFFSNVSVTCPTGGLHGLLGLSWPLLHS